MQKMRASHRKPVAQDCCINGASNGWAYSVCVRPLTTVAERAKRVIGHHCLLDEAATFVRDAIVSLKETHHY